MANLHALAKVAPALVERVALPVGTDHVGVDADGNWHARWGDRWFPLRLSGETCNAALAHCCADNAPIAVFGLGEPQLVLELLQRWPDRVVYGWERDPWILRLFLGAADVSGPLARGQLQLLLGVDLLTQTALASCDLVVHPVLGAIYDQERRLLLASPSLPLAFVARGGLFVDDVAEALWHQGFRVYTLDVHNCATAELAYAVTTVRPALLAAINYTDGLAPFCDQFDLPLLCWEIDPSTSVLPPCERPPRKSFVFTYREAHVQAFRAAGFPNVEYLPLAANPARRAPLRLGDEERIRYGGGRPTYVGSSIALQIPACEAAFVQAAQALDSPRITTSMARQWLQAALVAQSAAGNQSVLQDTLETSHAGLGASAHALAAAAEIAAAQKRLRYVAGLGDLGVWVWGDEGWRAMDILIPGHTAHFCGSASHKQEVTKIYNASAVNVDIGRCYQNDIVTMRVFDIAACGGFVLAEYSEALANIFKVGEDIECHSSFAELHDKTRYHLAHPDKAQALAARSREVVLRGHTIAARVAHMLGRTLS